MDINQKKTALDDDAILYQKRDNTVSKKDLTDLSIRQKLQYFKDYYLKLCIGALLLFIIGGNLIYTMFFRHQEVILNVVTINDTVLSDMDSLTEDLKELYQITNEDEQLLTVNNYYLEDINQQMAFTTKLVAGDIDVLLCDRETFSSYCSNGMFQDLSLLLSEETLQEFSDCLVTGQIEERDDSDQIISTGPELPFGINIADTALFTEYGGQAKEAIFCIPNSCKRTDAVQTFIQLAADDSVF